MRRTGLQAEVLISLALLMLASTGVVAAVIRSADEARLREVVGRSLGREARAPGPPTHSVFPGTVWWRIEGDGQPTDGTGLVRPWGVRVDPIDPVSREVAAEAARLGASVLVVDYRGYGASDGEPAFVPMLRDAEILYDALGDLLPEPRPVVALPCAPSGASRIRGSTSTAQPTLFRASETSAAGRPGS